MMTQLREKESELASLSEHRQVLLEQQKISEQTNLLLQSQIFTYNEEMTKKDAKIAVLKEESLKHRRETTAEYKRAIQERDDELSQLRPIMEELKISIHEYEEKENSRQPSKLEDKVTKIKGDLAIARGEILISKDDIDQLEKKIKSKEWVLKTLKEENDEQRSREAQLLAQINNLSESIETYETKFMGRGVDVPMLLAKLKDYDARTKELEGQVRRLTNKKLNELVLRSTLGPLQETEGTPNSSHSPKSPHKPNSPSSPNSPNKSNSLRSPKSIHSCPSHRSGEDIDEVLSENTFTVATENSFTVANRKHNDDEEETLYTNETDETEDQSYLNKGGVFDNFISDVEVGIDTIKMERLCCSQRSSQVATTSPIRDYRKTDSTPRFAFQ